MLDHKMDPDLLFDVRDFLVSTLQEEKLSDTSTSIRLDLIRRLTSAQSFLTKPYQDMKPSPKKDKSSSELIIHNLHHFNSLHSDSENTYENESCTSSGGSTSGAGSIECYEEIDHVNPSLNANNTYENIDKVSPSPSTVSILSTSQYNEITNQISSNVHVSTQYENTKQMLSSLNGNSPSIMSTKHGHVEILNKSNGPKDNAKSDVVDGERKLHGSCSVPSELATNGLKDRKASNGSVLSLHDIKFTGVLPVDVSKAADADLSKHKTLNGSVSYPLGGQPNTKINNSVKNSVTSNNVHQTVSSKTNTLPPNSSLSSLSASTKNLSSMNSNNVEILSISASALKYSAARCGNLLKKEKILFVDHFKRYWVALVSGYLYLYNNDKDSKASSVINVFSEADGTSIYVARPCMAKEKENVLEIVAPGQKTHYFAANSSADMELWISAINQSSQVGANTNGSTRSSPPPSLTSTTSASSGGNVNFSAPSGNGRQPSPPGSRPLSEACRELPSLPIAPGGSEQYYDEPDSLIRPVLHNYEHMLCQDALYNEIDEKESVNENYYNNISHSPPRKTDSTPLARKLDQEREQEKLRELCMLTYDQPKNSRKCIVELDEEAGEERNCEETTELFQNNCQSSRIQTIIQRMEASINPKDKPLPSQQTTPPLRQRSKRPESQLILSQQTYEPIRRKSTNRNSR